MVCALYIPEVRFGNVSTMEPIILGLVPQERYLKVGRTKSRFDCLFTRAPLSQVCYLCETNGRANKASSGACMTCNRAGCKQSFHVTCAQGAGLLCEEAGNYQDNVKYCGYCEYHYQRIVSSSHLLWLLSLHMRPSPPEQEDREDDSRFQAGQVFQGREQQSRVESG